MTTIAPQSSLFTVDEAFAGLCGVLRDALACAAKARDAGRSTQRQMRLATRCLAPLARLTRYQRSLLPDVTALVRQVEGDLQADYAAASARGEDVTPYLAARLTCQTHAARLATLPTTRATKADASAFALDERFDQLLQQLEADVAALQHRETHAAQPIRHAPPKPAKPLTQRARWLAEQQAKRGAKQA